MKIIAIGEININLSATEGGFGSLPGGLIARAAAILGRMGFATAMASDAGSDIPGDMAVGALSEAGVDTHSVDRFTEGRTALNIFSGLTGAPTRYDAYPEEAFDIVWPRIDEGDIVVFGGHYALDGRMRPRLARLLSHAAERKAVLVYVPAYSSALEPRITRVMPEILENLETAHLVVTTTADLATIFGTDNSAGCFADRVSFYCRSLVNIDAGCHRLEYFAGKEVTSAATGASPCESLLWQAGALAGLIGALAAHAVTPEALDAPGEGLRTDILEAMVRSGAEAAAEAPSWQLAVRPV